MLEWDKLRIGIGYDSHRLQSGKPLILGGITIAYDRGLAGHSDGDVLLHAIIDSMLGAAGLGDIGSFFPSEDPQYLGISSKILLETVYNLLIKEHHIINIDSIIVCQTPKLQTYFPSIRESIKKIVKTNIHVKATTTDKMNAEGQGLCISAQAICLLRCQ